MKKILILTFLTTLAALLSAQEAASTKGVALVVGNAAYRSAGALANPVNDATDVGTALQELGWDVTLVKDATLKQFREAVQAFGKKLVGQKAGLFYYAGHGLQSGTDNFLVPIDAAIALEADYPEQALRASYIDAAMDGARVPLKIVILDACRNNPFAKANRDLGAGARGLVPPSKAAIGSIYVYATSPGDVSQDGTGRNGVFTGAFVANLRVPGSDFQEIFDKTAASVSAATGGQQNPWINKSYYGKLYFVSPAEAQKLADTKLAALKAEQDRLTKELADRQAAMDAAKSQTERDRLALEQKTALAKQAAQKAEQDAWERAKALAAARAEEEKKNQAAGDDRARQAETQLANLRTQAEAARKASAPTVNADDPMAVVAQVAALGASIADIQKQFDEALARRVAESKAAFDQRAVGIGKYEMEFWENQKEFDARKAQALGLAQRDFDNEVGALRASFTQNSSAQTADLLKQRDAQGANLISKDWPVAAGNLTLTRGDFDRDAKSWPLTVSSTQPAFTQTLTYQLKYSNADELKTAAVAADNAWKAGAWAPQAFFRVSQPWPGFFQATLSRVQVVDLTKADPKTKAPQVVVAGAVGTPLGWVGKGPSPATVTVTVPRAAAVYANAAKLADLKPGQTYPWTTSAFGPASLEARYAEGDVEALAVTLQPGAPVAASFVRRAKPLMTMVSVAGGTFTMGSPASEAGRDSDEAQHQVTVGSFSIGTTEVTQAQYTRVMGVNPSNFKGDNLPVEKVSWYDAVAYCNKLSQSEGLTPAYTVNGTDVTWNRSANGYRLPTEAEWEYAARGGTQSRGTTYAGSNSPDEVAWHTKTTSDSGTKPVGTKAPNELGLYDMSGNVWELCWDWYSGSGSGSQSDPAGPSSGKTRVIRGGGWYRDASYLRSAYRGHLAPDGQSSGMGFRVVLSTVR